MHPLPDDNGKLFLSKYFEEQKEGNRKIPRHPTNKRCQCEKCAMNSIPLPHELDKLLANNSAIALFDKDDQMERNNNATIVTVSGKTVIVTVTKATIHVPQNGLPILVAHQRPLQPPLPPPPQQQIGFPPLFCSGTSSEPPLVMTSAWQFNTAPSWQYSLSMWHSSCRPRYALWAHKPR
jgi:hypothetical protein